MTAQLIDGNALSRTLRADVAQRADALKNRGVVPGLAVVLVGDNPASDMALAAMGDIRWRGVLVRTGVFVDTDATCGATTVVDTVSDAVDYILKATGTEVPPAPPTTKAA